MTCFEILVRGKNFQLDKGSAERFGFLTRQLVLEQSQDAAIEKAMDIIRGELRGKVFNKSPDDQPAMYVDDITVRDIGTIRASKEDRQEMNWFPEGEDDG